jgi:hypothetical protein
MRMTKEISRIRLRSMPVDATKDREKKAMIAKNKVNPRMIPKGRFLEPLREPARKIGSIGSMQGERIRVKPSVKLRRMVIMSDFMVQTSPHPPYGHLLPRGEKGAEMI